MKNVLKPFLALVLFAAAGFALVGCVGTDSLAVLERNLDRSSQTIDSLDQVSETDLSTTDVQGLAAWTNETTVSELAYIQTALDDSIIAQIRTLHQEIVDLHLSILQTRSEIAIARETLRSTIDEFRTAGLTLSAADKATVDAWIAEIKDLNLTLKDTIGDVYQQMKNLRGNYDAEHVDLILSTFTEVKATLQIRADALNRIQVILTDANTLLQSYLGVE